MEGCDECGDTVRHDCPRRLLDATTWAAVSGWKMLSSHGVLPDPGGWLDQTAWFLAACGEIDAIVNEDREKRRKRMEAQRGR